MNRALDACTMRADDQREILDLVARFDSVFNIFGEDEREMLDAEIESLINERREALSAISDQLFAFLCFFVFADC